MEFCHFFSFCDVSSADCRKAHFVSLIIKLSKAHGQCGLKAS